ncbi:unnamed protein product [Blepharisma stoltei]|uniref:Uncharacterized protein n=1 Tax=Blepharisma stoltei TaxID=1481888 RepID=A0AAU9K9V9_9CILI|nr:unnamed protein product [Blepharisma stoltei]
MTFLIEILYSSRSNFMRIIALLFLISPYIIMRRTKRFGIHSNRTIKRCYGRGCCEHDLARVVEWSCSRYTNVANFEEAKQNWVKSSLHKHFFGNTIYGKGKVPFNRATHRKSKYRRNSIANNEDMNIEKDIDDAKFLWSFRDI